MSGIVVSDALRTSSPELEDTRIERSSGVVPSDTLELLAYLGDARAARVVGQARALGFGEEAWFAGLVRWGPALPVWVAVQAIRVAAEPASAELAQDLATVEALEAAHLFALAPSSSMARNANGAALRVPERFTPTRRTCLRLASREAALAASHGEGGDLALVANSAWRSFSFAQAATELSTSDFETRLASHLVAEILLGREPVF